MEEKKNKKYVLIFKLFFLESKVEKKEADVSKLGHNHKRNFKINLVIFTLG